jgi:PAS domain S-box-containing protein
MIKEAFLKFPVARSLLGRRTFSDAEENTKGLLLAAILSLCLPMPIVSFFLIALSRDDFTILPPIAELVLLSLIVGLRLKVGLRTATVVFGLTMESVFIHGVLRLESPSMIIGLVFIPFFAALTGGWLAGSAMLAPPLAFIVGLSRLFPLETDVRANRVILFETSLPAETINLIVLLGLVFLAACIVERITHNLFTAHAAEQRAIGFEMAVRKEKERLLETVFRAVPVPLFVKDHDLRYSMCSDSFYDFIGIERSEVIGSRLEDLKAFKLQGTFGDTDRQMLDTGLSQRYSAKLTRPDGGVLSITVVKVPLMDEAGHFVGTVGAILDETDRYNQERKLEDLLDSNRSALALLGHDLKNPIGAFRNLIHSLGEQECVDPEEFKEILTEMGTSLDALYRLLEELLDWAKADASIEEWMPQALPVAPLVEDLFTLVSLQAEAKNISLNTQVPSDLVIHADRNMLETVLRNLIGNAVKFTGRGGSISVAGLHSEVDRGTRVTVTDTGIGLSAAMIVSLSQKGMIRQRRGTEGERGTGLGLGLCRRLIDRHGGNLSIDSIEGSGSTFSIFFPDRDELSGALNQ